MVVAAFALLVAGSALATPPDRIRLSYSDSSRTLPGHEAPRQRLSDSHANPEPDRTPFVARLVSLGRMIVSLGRHRRP